MFLSILTFQTILCSDEKEYDGRGGSFESKKTEHSLDCVNSSYGCHQVDLEHGQLISPKIEPPEEIEKISDQTDDQFEDIDLNENTDDSSTTTLPGNNTSIDENTEKDDMHGYSADVSSSEDSTGEEQKSTPPVSTNKVQNKHEKNNIKNLSDLATAASYLFEKSTFFLNSFVNFDKKHQSNTEKETKNNEVV